MESMAPQPQPPQPNAEINGEQILWRRLTDPRWIVDENGERRVSSAAFKDSTEERVVSVHLAYLASLETVVSIPPVCFGVAEILARHPQELGHSVRYTPTPEDISHTSIIPPVEYGSARRKRDTKAMALKSRLIEKVEAAGNTPQISASDN